MTNETLTEDTEHKLNLRHLTLADYDDVKKLMDGSIYSTPSNSNLCEPSLMSFTTSVLIVRILCALRLKEMQQKRLNKRIVFFIRYIICICMSVKV